MNAAHKAAFLLAGNLTILNIQNLSKPVIEFNFGTRTREGLFATVHVCAQGLEGLIKVSTPGGKYYAVIKKGSNANATLWLCTSLNHTSDLALRRSTLSFRPHASSTQDEKLASGFSVFSRLMLASISSITSWGKRIPLVSDLLFLYPVAILKSPIKCICTIRENINIKRIDVFMHQRLRCLCTLSTGKAQVIPKIAKPRSARTLAGPLTKPLYEVTIMADSQHTQTRPKFQYRFLALDRANRRATPCRLTVEASTEHEARLILCAHFILSLAARLPVSGSAHV